MSRARINEAKKFSNLLEDYEQAKKEHAELEKIAENNSDYYSNMEAHLANNKVKELKEKISSVTKQPSRKGGKSIKSRKNKNKKTLRVRKHRSTQHRKLLLAW